MVVYRRLLTLACLGLWAGSLIAASAPGPRYTVDVLTVDQGGLPQNSVIALTQTRDGYLWLGTGNGLARFDGLHFRTYDETDTQALSGSKVVKLFEDSRTNLWVGTETAGVLLVDKNGKVTRPFASSHETEGPLVAVCEDPSGAIWFSMARGQLYRYAAGKATLVANGCRGLIEDSGIVWIGTPDGRLAGLGPIQTAAATAIPVTYDVPVGRLDFLLASKGGGYWRLANGRIGKWKADHLERELGPYPWSPSVPVLAACEDREGNLVVGTYGDGVYWFDAQGKATRLEGLSHSFIWSLAFDREGNLWVGTDGGGLNRVKRQLFDVLKSSQGATVQSICEDAKGGLWIGYNGQRVDHWTVDDLQQFTRDHGWVPGSPADAAVRTVLADSKQNLWVGTAGAGLFALIDGALRPAPGSEAIPSPISALYQDTLGRTWVGASGTLAFRDETGWKLVTNTLPNRLIQAIAADTNGALWFGTAGQGLYRLQDDQLTAFSRTNGLPSDNVSCLWLDDQHVLWIGTSSGLARLKSGKWTTYTTREGLVGNSLTYLLEDGDGFLWIGSNAGLMRVRKQSLNDFADAGTNSIHVRDYGTQDGLPTRECTQGSQPAACRTRDGKLWFPTIKGLAFVDPALLGRNTNPPPVIIDSVRIDGELVTTNGLRAPLVEQVTVPAGKEALEIDFNSLNLSAPEKGRFKYRLEDYESVWTESPGNIRSVRYSQLPPGHYRFHLQACNEDDVWNETGSSLAVTVLPPFWRTWWFLTGATLFLLGTIVGSVHYVSTQRLQRQLALLRQQEALEKERARIARDIHDQLGASLTQVSLLGELIEGDKDRPQEVEAHARQISQTALETTRALDEIVWTVNPSNDTLDGLITYVCKHAQDYFEVAGLTYRLEVPAHLPAATISPEVRHNVFLASKEAITNVVRHAKASSALIRLRLNGSSFTLEIEDNGKGLGGLDPKAAELRNGLRNMRKRMEDIGGEFSISSRPEGGASVRLTAPLRSN